MKQEINKPNENISQLKDLPHQGYINRGPAIYWTGQSRRTKFHVPNIMTHIPCMHNIYQAKNIDSGIESKE